MCQSNRRTQGTTSLQCPPLRSLRNPRPPSPQGFTGIFPAERQISAPGHRPPGLRSSLRSRSFAPHLDRQETRNVGVYQPGTNICRVRLTTQVGLTPPGRNYGSAYDEARWRGDAGSKDVMCNRPGRVGSGCLLPPYVAAAVGGYHLLKKIVLGGEGLWDYLICEGAARGVHISRGSHVMVVDADNYAVAGDMPGTVMFL